MDKYFENVELIAKKNKEQPTRKQRTMKNINTVIPQKNLPIIDNK